MVESPGQMWLSQFYMPFLPFAQLGPTICSPVGHSLPGSSVHGIFQARILEQVAISYTGNRPDPGIKPASLASSALLLYHCDTWKAQFYIRGNHKAIRDEWLHLQICNMNITLRCSGLSFATLFQPIHERKFFHLGKRFAERKVNELNHLNGQIGKILLFLLHVTFLPEIK